MLLDRSQFRLHFAFALLAGLITLALTAWYYWQSTLVEQWPGGGSTVGLTCGVVAGIIMVFEMLLSPRKWLRRYRLFPTRYWLAAHLWFGLASVPLAILHCGFHLGGTLPTVFMVLFLLTGLSGLYGWAVQNILPRYLLRNIPAETIAGQIDHVSSLALGDLKDFLIRSCGQRPATADEELELFDEPDFDITKTIVIGAVRQAGRTRGRTLETKSIANAKSDREMLWSALDNIEPFLLAGHSVTSPVTDRRHASVWFQRLRKDREPQTVDIINTMEALCDQRRQFDTQKAVHRHLHGWLPVHIGLSVAAILLLIAHVITALRYW